MKRIVISLIIITSLAYLGCPGKVEEATKVVTKDGDMIEVLTPAPNDTFSWVLVSGNASAKQGLFNLELLDKEGEVLTSTTVELAAAAPDTAAFASEIFLTKDAPLQKGKLKAFTPDNEAEAAIFPVYFLPSPAEANDPVQRFYKAFGADDFETAYELLAPEEAAYPDFYEGAVSFAAPPTEPEELASWKKETERLRLLALLRCPIYDLPQQGLFLYRVWIEHTLADNVKVEEAYVFLKRQPDGSFRLYRPRKDMYKPGE
ncbi:hypothetical protein JXM67_10405 [candidate division WOR-3 bacterium]|nr:hypothetical protein [candidate division WOR-3 bacterium]